MAFKEVTDPTMSQLMEAWAVVQEAEKAMGDETEAIIDEVYPGQPAKPPGSDKPGDNKADEVDLPLTQAMFSAGMTRIMSAVEGSKSKETDQITAALSRIDQLQEQVKQAQGELLKLNGSQPAAMGGYRATKLATPVENSKIVQRTKTADEKYADAIKEMGVDGAQFMPAAEGFAKSIMNPGNNPPNSWDEGLV